MSTDESATDRKLALLQGSALFRRLPREELIALADVSSLQMTSAGTQLIRAGDAGEMIYLLDDVPATVAWTREHDPVARTVGSTLLGWAALIRPYSYIADVTVLTHCELLAVPASEVRRIVNEYPEVGLDVMNAVAAIARDRFVVAIARFSERIVPRLPRARVRPSIDDHADDT